MIKFKIADAPPLVRMVKEEKLKCYMLFLSVTTGFAILANSIKFANNSTRENKI